MTTHNLFGPAHPNLIVPTDADSKIWRYLSFAKYAALLRTRQLYFGSAATFEDRWEGSHGLWYAAGVELISYFKKVQWSGTSLLDFNKQWNWWIRGWTFANCWHENTSDSEAMWKLYASDEGSVAIGSTYARLRSVLPGDIGIGRVLYHDFYATPPEPMPFVGYPSPFVFKRKSLAHEREVRAIIQEVPLNPNGSVDLWNPDHPPGKAIDVDLAVLIERVHVQPNAPRWLVETVADVTKLYGLKVAVEQAKDEALF